MAEHFENDADNSSKRSRWPGAILPLSFVQLILSATILAHAAYNRLTQEHMAREEAAMSTICISAALFTLLSAVWNVSSSLVNLAVLEVMVPDTLSLALWGGICSSAVVEAVGGARDGSILVAPGAALLSLVLTGKLVIASWVQIVRRYEARLFDEESAVRTLVASGTGRGELEKLELATEVKMEDA